MAEQEDDLLGIEVDADDYAETAAGDTPSVPRTYQSEADFQAQKAQYTAKIDGEAGKAYENLIAAVPALSEHQTAFDGASKVRLSKKDFQLLGYAAGEMYYDKQYDGLLELCERIKEICDLDAKTAESLERWSRRCRERLLT